MIFRTLDLTLPINPRDLIYQFTFLNQKLTCSDDKQIYRVRLLEVSSLVDFT